jgi:hypothetical protein
LEGEFGGAEESAEEVGAVGGGDGLAGEGKKSVGVVGDASGGGDVLAVGPGRFDGVELGGVGREVGEVDVADASGPVGEGPGFVLAEVVEDDDEGRAEGSPESSQVGDEVGGDDAASGEELGVESAAVAGGGDGERAEDGDLQAVPQAVGEGRGVTGEGPGAAAVGDRQEAGFVEEDEGGAESAGFFLTPGQRVRTQAAMAASSRSEGLAFGRWGVNPRARSRVGR